MSEGKKLKINEEYEKLVPPIQRESLFEDSEDYESLRQYIIDQPRIYFSKKEYPFSGVQLTSYVDYKKQEIIDKERENNKHIFYLKQSQKGRSDFCDAAGYYVKETRGFVLLPYSHIINKAQPSAPKGYGRKGALDGVNLYTLSPITFWSPEVAASYVLGQSAGLDEWIDSKGKGLLAYYKELEPKPEPVININEEEPFFTPSILQESKKEEPQQTLVFHIKETNVCDASGFYDPSSGYFYLMKDSKIALYVTNEFSQTPIGKARERLIFRNCKKVGVYYVVQKDSKCRTATAAACYAMGKAVTYVEWERENGMALKDFYPDKFFQKKTLFEKLSKYVKTPISHTSGSPIEEGGRHLFYIKKDNEPKRRCDAKGYYDSVTNKFIIMSGSTWSMDVTNSYQDSVSELMRRNIIKRDCKLIFGAYKLFKDVLCDSPSQAASYVIGRNANGWEEWTDKKGRTLKKVFNFT